MFVFGLVLLAPVLFIIMFLNMPFIVCYKCNELIEKYPNYKIWLNVLKVLGIIFTTIPILSLLVYILPFIHNALSILNF